MKNINEPTGNTNTLRYIIYGAGAIGGVLGGYLALDGKEVIMVGRPAQVDALRKDGLHLISPAGDHTIELPAVSSPAQISFKPNDVVFLTVKSQNTNDALRDLHNVVKDIPVFCCQNGVGNEQIAAKYFKRVYGVRVRIGALYVRDGEVTAKNDPPGGLVIGRYPSGKDSLLETVATDLRKAGFWIRITAEIMPYKWGQLIGNLANAPSAITGSTEDEGKRIIIAARLEAAAILKKASIPWVPEEDLAREVPESTVMRGTISGRHTNSTWQSLTRQQGAIETEYFNGEIVRLAKRIGMKAPVNEGLLRIANEMAAGKELPGKYSVAELAKLLGLN